MQKELQLFSSTRSQVWSEDATCSLCPWEKGVLCLEEAEEQVTDPFDNLTKKNQTIA